MRVAATPLLVGLAGAITTAGVLAWLVPPPVPMVAVLPAAVAAPEAPLDGSSQAAAILTFQEIVRANVFSDRRAPPPRRYVPPHLVARARAPAASTPAAPRIRLYGVATGERGSVALIDADPAIPGAEIYRPGDAVGIYHLESIATSFVVLTGPGGRRTVGLEATARRSP